MQAQYVPDYGAKYADQAQAVIEDREAEAAELDREQEYLEWCFLTAAKAGDASAPARFAPRCRDYGSTPFGSTVRAMRYQTVAEVMLEALGYSDTPSTDDVMALLLDAANGKPVQATAIDMLTKMAKRFAAMGV